MSRLSVGHGSLFCSLLWKSTSCGFHSTKPVTKNPYYFYDLSSRQPRHTFDPLAIDFGGGSHVSSEERFRRVFGEVGTREESRREAQKQARVIAGVKVPARPEEPTNCCMSGCVNCVWELYKDELEEWRQQRKQAKHELLFSDKYKNEPWPVDFGKKPESPDQADAQMADEDTWKDMDVAIRVFVATEKRLKEKRRAEKKGVQGEEIER